MPSYLDIGVVVIVFISAILAMLRGFTREILAILSWGIAAGSALYGYPFLVVYIRPYVQKEILAAAASAIVIFFVVLILVSIITVRLSDAILDSKIGALDRSLGFLFGIGRGFLICAIAFMFFDWFMAADSQPAWVTNAKTHPFLVQTVDAIRSVLPEDGGNYFINFIKNKKNKAVYDAGSGN